MSHFWDGFEKRANFIQSMARAAGGAKFHLQNAAQRTKAYGGTLQKQFQEGQVKARQKSLNLNDKQMSQLLKKEEKAARRAALNKGVPGTAPGAVPPPSGGKLSPLKAGLLGAGIGAVGSSMFSDDQPQQPVQYGMRY